MELLEALRTNPAVREFTAEPVPDEVVTELLDVARFAPSGGNRQPWRVAVVRDPELRRQLADLCIPVQAEYLAIAATGVTPFAAVGEQPEVVAPTAVPNPVFDRVEDVPVMLVVAADLSRVAMMDKDLERPPITAGASVYPFVHSLLLAARDRDLGGVLMTFLARAEAEAGPLLGLPDGWAIAATVFIGHPAKRATKLRRRAVAEFATVDRFDGPPLA
jgi:nitroreductase